MNHQKLLSICRRLMETPTAPFYEHAMREVIVGMLDEIPEVSWKLDGYGNLLATYRPPTTKKSGRPSPARWVLGAHMDHPGFVRDPKSDDGWTFLGGVPKRYLDKPSNRKRVREFGDFAMWDVEPFRYDTRSGRVFSRACDDLIGCATMIATFGELSRIGAAVTVHAAFTRAEELGFFGADHLAANWPFGKSTTFLSLETSTPRGGAEHAAGPVIRVGDRLSVFDDVATGTLTATAEAAEIPHQRCLLDGGACEASGMMAHGIRAAGISIMLGNYHNCGPRDRIEPEFVDLIDVKSLVSLLIRVLTDPAPNPRSQLKKRIRQRVGENRRHLLRADALNEGA